VAVTVRFFLFTPPQGNIFTISSSTVTFTSPCHLADNMRNNKNACVEDFPDSKCLVEQGLGTPVATEAGFVPVQVLKMENNMV
jgi:hypothetical protein